MFGALAKKPSEGASGLARFDSSSSVARRGGNEGEGVIPDPAELDTDGSAQTNGRGELGTSTRIVAVRIRPSSELVGRCRRTT